MEDDMTMHPEATRWLEELADKKREEPSFPTFSAIPNPKVKKLQVRHAIPLSRISSWMSIGMTKDSIIENVVKEIIRKMLRALDESGALDIKIEPSIDSVGIEFTGTLLVVKNE